MSFLTRLQGCVDWAGIINSCGGGEWDLPSLLHAATMANKQASIPTVKRDALMLFDVERERDPPLDVLCVFLIRSDALPCLALPRVNPKNIPGDASEAISRGYTNCV